MEKENVLEIEFLKVWDKWAWRITRNTIDFKNTLGEIKYQNIKVVGKYKNGLFLWDYIQDDWEEIQDYTLLDKNEKEEVEEFINYINEKYGIPKRWRAEENNRYYTIFGENIEKKSLADDKFYNLGNYFKTKEEAEKVKEELDKFWAKVRAGEIGRKKMREIKFRAWDIDERKFIVNETDRLGCGDTKKCMSERVDFENNSVEINADERYIFSEYTGLKDMKEKEIYEGDILFESFREKYYKVIFENGSFRAEFEGDFEEYSFDLIDVVAQGYEVVGNIYQNPELLGVS